MTSHLPGGATQTVFAWANGEKITDTTPPASFNPLTADAAQLTEYGFPARPSGGTALEDWQTAMAAYKPTAAPTAPLRVQTGPSTWRPTQLGAKYSNWAGYSAGMLRQQSNTYVAVRSKFTVPSNSSTCTAGVNTVGFWIGLGGTLPGTNDLVQQGIVCGDIDVESGTSNYAPFTEFANTENPVAFCGTTSWAFPAGHTLYQNMSFEASNNVANFYLEDEASGDTHSCQVSAPRGWSYDGNTAEWIGEAPTGTADHFSPVAFSDADTELDSNGSWVPFASQTYYNEFVSGESSSSYCMAPGGVGSNEDSFTISWHQAAC